MTDYYVNTTFTNDGDGTTPLDAAGTGAFNSWASVLTAAATVAQNTLYILNVIPSSAALAMTALGGVAGTKTIIRGDYAGSPGGFAFTGAAHYLSVNDDYLTIRNLTITSDVACVYLNQKGNVDVQYCALRPGSASAAVNFASDGNVTYANVDLSHNTMSGGQYGVNWYMSAAGRNCDLTDCTIIDNTITGATYSAIHLRAVAGAADSLMTRITVTDNVISNCSTEAVNARAAIDIEHGTEASVGVGADVSVGRNTISSCGQGSVAGAIAVKGFASSKSAYGKNNAIFANTITNIDGPNGGCNVFYNSYLWIVGNYIDTITTDTIDGDGILVDHSNENVWVHRNQIYNLPGQAAAVNSGCGIMILDSTLVKCTGNIGDNMKIGMFLGADDYVGGGVVDHQSSTCYNNTFTGITYAAVHVSSACGDPSVHTLRNNRFEGDGYSVDHESAGAEHTESNNAFIGFSSGLVTHTLDATDVTTAAGCAKGGVYIANVLAYDDLPLPLRPDIGAVQDRNAPDRRFGVGGVSL